MSRRQQAAEGLADVAGSATLLIGLALVIDPDRARALLVLPASRRRARLIGCLDLSLVPGLLMSCRRRPWMLARAAFNAALAAQYKRTARGPSSANRRRAGQALSVLTVIDVTVGLIMSPDPSLPTPG